MVVDTNREKNYTVYKITRLAHKEINNLEAMRIYDREHEPQMNDTLRIHVGILSAPENKKKVRRLYTQSAHFDRMVLTFKFLAVFMYAFSVNK